MPLDTIRRVFAALDADTVITIRWCGGQLDRLLDERHADITGRMAGLLRRNGWQVLTEVTFSEYGERGSIDLLAWHPATRTLLIVEVKTEIASAEEMLRRHDAKARLAPAIARDRFGQAPATVARLLVVAEGPTNRRRLSVSRMSLVAPIRRGVGRCVPGCARPPERSGASCSSRAGPDRTPAVSGESVGPRLHAGCPRNADPAHLPALRVVSSVARRV